MLRFEEADARGAEIAQREVAANGLRGVLGQVVDVATQIADALGVPLSKLIRKAERMGKRDVS